MKRHLIFVLSAIFLGILVGLSFSHGKRTQDCAKDLRNINVVGDSMKGLIENGSSLVADYNYYDCHPILVHDIVVIKVDDRFIVKQIAAIPGDEIEIKSRGQYSHMSVNGSLLVNPENAPYIVRTAAETNWIFFISATKNVLPTDHFIALGTSALGSFDSTRLGPIHSYQIVAKVTLSK